MILLFIQKIKFHFILRPALDVLRPLSPSLRQCSRPPRLIHFHHNLYLLYYSFGARSYQRAPDFLHLTMYHTIHPSSAPAVFVSTSSSCKNPVCVMCCMTSILQEHRKPVSTHSHPFRNGLNRIGSSTPKGMNMMMFSINIACSGNVRPQVSNMTRLTSFRLPGSLHRKAV